MERLTIKAARALQLVAQGIEPRRRRAAGKGDVLEAIRTMGALQIDSISVVARSPYLVLWSRLGTYQPRWLDELLAEGKLFEYWSHAACFLPIEDFALYRRDMLEGHPYARALLAESAEQAEAMRTRLRSAGEARSTDFERTDGNRAGWWSWKPEKRLLEALYSRGEVMIARRDRNFQRVYSLRERVLPGWDDSSLPAEEDSRRALALASVRALGVARARWVPDYFKRPANGIASLLDELATAGELLTIEVEGLKGRCYVHPVHQDLLARAIAGTLQPRRTTLLSPFDPIVWHRDRARELFGFSYSIEVYTPAAKRRYGYFTLPILHRGALVGRLDPKAHRAEGRLQIRSVHLEDGVPVSDDLISGLSGALSDFATWQGLDRVEIDWSEPPGLRAALLNHRSTT